jgi:hypothetical protein
MKLFSVLFTLTALAAAASPELAAVKTVYLLPMSSGLDQYLAVHLTNGNALQVVTDPQKADAVFTDNIGSSLEQKLHELYPVAAKEDAKEEETGKNETKGDDFKPTMAPLSRGKGSIFLVDRKSRAVLWSMYARPSNSQADVLNRLAQKIATQFEKSLKAK